MDIDKIYWHTAVMPALQLELEPYLDVLSFEAEHQLSSKGLQIDLVVIKKEPNQVIDNPLARIFRTINLVEYKSPAVSLSLDEFHRALAYVFLYGSIHKVDVTDMSLSVILTKKPEEIAEYLQHRLHYGVEEGEQGIYRVTGFPFPLQMIETKKLSKEQRYLPLLHNRLNREEVAFILREAKKKRNLDISAFLDIIRRANVECFEEAFRMMGKKTLEEAFDRFGITAQAEARGKAQGIQEGEARGKAQGIREGEARGEARGIREGKAQGIREGEARGIREGKVQVAQNLIKKGWDSETIAETTQLDLLTVESLMGAAQS